MELVALSLTIQRQFAPGQSATSTISCAVKETGYLANTTDWQDSVATISRRRTEPTQRINRTSGGCHVSVNRE